MAFQNNTVLITGGSSGIGLQLAKLLTEKNNRVIICGRSEDKLAKAKKLIPGLITITCDISDKSECFKLAAFVKEHYPECNVLINNAAIVHLTNFYEDEQMIDRAELEIRTNLIAPVVLSKIFIPIIEKNPAPKIINITSGLAYIPRAVYPVYNATKAALHSFTQVLRMQLKERNIEITEVMFPAVDTPWHKGNPPAIAISAEKAVSEMIEKLEKGEREIKVGKVKLLYMLSRLAPGFATKKMNQLK